MWAHGGGGARTLGFSRVAIRAGALGGGGDVVRRRGLGADKGCRPERCCSPLEERASRGVVGGELVVR